MFYHVMFEQLSITSSYLTQIELSSTSLVTLSHASGYNLNFDFNLIRGGSQLTGEKFVLKT